jgi:hypothetical protein
MAILPLHFPTMTMTTMTAVSGIRGPFFNEIA